MKHGRFSRGEPGKFLERASLACETHVVIGEPAKNTVRIARSKGVDGIVTGTHGMGAVGNLLPEGSDTG